METIAVYAVASPPDAPLARIEAELEEAGFTVRPADEMDLAARRGLDRVFVGVGPHEEGLVARWKAKSLVPGRTREIHRTTQAILTSVLGQPARTLTPSEDAP